jgi:spermidine synthase
VLGLGAGTVARVFEGEAGLDWSWIGVELDPVVVELGRAWLDLGAAEKNGAVWSGVDARLALRVARGAFDQIVLDCYSNQVEIPAHLCTREFFEEVRAQLAAGGWLAANLGGFDFDDPVVATVARTCARAFGSPVLLVRVPSSRNFVLFARHAAPLPLDPDALEHAPQATRLALGPRLLPGFTRSVEPDEPGLVLSDDHCPIELLQQRSIREAQSRRRKAEGA